METMPYKEILTAVAIALTLAAFIPYLISIVQGKTKPHVFSWIIWGSTTFVVFLAQIEGKGGIGAWPIGVSGIITLIIALLAYLKRSEISLTKADWLFFLSALSSLPLWYLTSDPLAAVVILTTIDVLGFTPTLKKVYYAPYSESLVFFSLLATRNILSIGALETHSTTTVLFPAVIATACVLLIIIAGYRRKAFKNNSK